MKNQDMKHSHHQQKVLNLGKANNHIEMYNTPSQASYFYPPYMKPNSQYPSAYKQNTKYDNKDETHPNYHGYPPKNCDKGGRFVPNHEMSPRNRMDMGSHSSSHHPHDVHLMTQMMNSQYNSMDKSKYLHPNSIRYPSKPMEDVSQTSIPSAMAPGPLPTQRYCHPNSPFRMPQLYPSNPPIPSPREYFNNSTNSKTISWCLVTGIQSPSRQGYHTPPLITTLPHPLVVLDKPVLLSINPPNQKSNKVGKDKIIPPQFRVIHGNVKPLD
uniref:Uncharacterized protein LOC111123892 n=1 Tax=Crassostrea virginica TaxID=6565 RepID=A0A8B8D619_CRAVI|nr:uncharacterized protein LOC111123892 [Crassostrea virginica]XP_022322281.1 uncharacterized protein LOC111123892 [Crassostrea virginica]XP_022322289.1 uncharacterized protein LOC111123892 [Crassostrea virginica]XP_022322298.1 uncharacterized protein LOC111123892 [Crassostrea virginica]XP_022322308.1 uncharacterized protein LOC111123892 [Crassostrea virginica]